MKKVRGIKSLSIDAIYSQMDSPVGTLTLIASGRGLHCIWWEDDLKVDSCANMLKQLKRTEDHEIIIQTKQQLKEYFQGARREFDLPLAFDGTAFQLQAWKQLINIPYATTISYKEQALQIGCEKKARAVGMANGQNPLSIIIPCHRVIGSNGLLTGFAGGMDKKAVLLKIENENSIKQYV